MATIKTPNHTPQMATVRPKSKKPLPKDLSRTGSIIPIPFSSSYADKRVTILEEQPLEGSEGSIEESKRVISGGKGLKKKDNFERIVRLASLMHGAVGASREAVDRGWIGYSHQVGLSGKTISPELYMAIGISGAVQHLAGIKTSKYIVSINDDITAPIIQISDFAIVGDLFTICDEIERQITNKGGRCD
jgi:electron transfer flavoprotein alpha subunit